jgi:hypothetical protein
LGTETGTKGTGKGTDRTGHAKQGNPEIPDEQGRQPHGDLVTIQVKLPVFVVALHKVFKHIPLDPLNITTDKLHIHTLKRRQLTALRPPPTVDLVDINEGKTAKDVNVRVTVLVILNNPKVMEPRETLVAKVNPHPLEKLGHKP